jgi:hypothetical protein
LKAYFLYYQAKVHGRTAVYNTILFKKKKQRGVSLIQSITACKRRVEEVGTTRNSPKHTNSVNVFKITSP